MSAKNKIKAIALLLSTYSGNAMCEDLYAIHQRLDKLEQRIAIREGSTITEQSTEEMKPELYCLVEAKQHLIEVLKCNESRANFKFTAKLPEHSPWYVGEYTCMLEGLVTKRCSIMEEK